MRKGQFWSHLVILIIWLLYLGPCIWQAEWFYLDDPTHISGASQVFEGNWWALPDAGTGRFTPASWLYRGLVWKIVGDSARGTYLFQSILILATAFLIYAIVWRTGGGRVGATIGAVFFFLTAPFAENACTLGKAEPLQVFVILIGSYGFLLWLRKASRLRHWHLATALLAALLCVWVKETGSWIVVAFAVSFCVAAYLGSRPADRPSLRKRLFLVLAGGVGAALIARSPYYILQTDYSEPYFSYQVTFALIAGNVRYYLEQTPEVFVVGLVASLLVAGAWWGRLRGRPVSDDSHSLALATALLGVGWGLLGGLLTWRMAIAYYLYVSAALFNLVLCVYLVPVVLRYWKSRAFVRLAALTVVLVGVKFHSGLYGYYVSTTQREAMQVYGQAMGQFLRRVQPRHRLYFDQWTSSFEGSIQTNILVSGVYGRTDLLAVGIEESLQSTASVPVVVRTGDQGEATIRKHDWPIRGDYVLRIAVYKPGYWGVRGIAPDLPRDGKGIETLGARLRPVWHTRSAHRSVFFMRPFRSLRLEETWLAASLFAVESDGRDTRIDQGRREFLPGGTTWWIDHWVPEEFDLRVMVDPERPVLRFVGELAPYVPLPEISVVGPEKQFLARIKTGRSGRFTSEVSLRVLLSKHAGEYATLRFLADKSFVPAQATPPSDDTRELSWILCRLQLVPEPPGAGATSISFGDLGGCQATW